MTHPSISYQVAIPQPSNHLFHVTLRINNWKSPTLDLKMPVWTPGSYLVREYAKNIQSLQAKTTDTSERLISKKVSKNHWQITTDNISHITIEYLVFANELSVRTNHLDSTHGYFNGAALFLYIPGWEKEQIKVEVIPPKQWIITTSLPRLKGTNNVFIAEDFDTLVDSPFEIGTHQVYEFEVLGIPHELAIWGQGNANPQKIIYDTTKIIETEARIFGGLPYDSYLFLLHLTHNSYGGLEHRNCCSLIYQRFGFRNKEKYLNFMQLVAHEFFHLWNVKRIRPKELESYNYEEENYTTSLWFSEGTTSYYDLLIPLRAGIYDYKTLLKKLGEEINRYMKTPGRKIQSAAEASFDAWIKLYRPDSNSGNSQMSYYLKGELISLILDMLIRYNSNNNSSLDDVMRRLWENFGKSEQGFTPKELQEEITLIAGEDLSEFWVKYIHGVEELPLEKYLKYFGLELKMVMEENPYPHLGIRVDGSSGKEVIKFVEAGSGAENAGIQPDNELLAIDGIRVKGEQLAERLKDYQAGDMIDVSVFHQDQLRTVKVKLALPQPVRYEVVEVKEISALQQQRLFGWLKDKI